MSESTSRTARSRAVRRILAVVVLLEALLCAGYGVFLAVETLVAPAADRMAAAIMAVIAVLLGGGLVIAARGAGRGRRAARAPIIVWQLMQFAVARLTAGTGWAAFGMALAVLSVAAAAGAMWPGVLKESASDT